MAGAFEAWRRENYAASAHACKGLLERLLGASPLREVLRTGRGAAGVGAAATSPSRGGEGGGEAHPVAETASPTAVSEMVAELAEAYRTGKVA